ncbi:hypothetical protein M2273_004429 [Mucilaginibacter lappiensis]|jgi:hypothetical protein
MLHYVQHDKLIFLLNPLSSEAEERGGERSDAGVSLSRYTITRTNFIFISPA